MLTYGVRAAGGSHRTYCSCAAPLLGGLMGNPDAPLDGISYN